MALLGAHSLGAYWRGLLISRELRGHAMQVESDPGPAQQARAVCANCGQVITLDYQDGQADCKTSGGEWRCRNRGLSATS